MVCLPVDHCARRENIGDGEERVEEHGNAEQNIVDDLIAPELADPHQNCVQ